MRTDPDPELSSEQEQGVPMLPADSELLDLYRQSAAHRSQRITALVTELGLATAARKRTEQRLRVARTELEQLRVRTTRLQTRTARLEKQLAQVTATNKRLESRLRGRANQSVRRRARRFARRALRSVRRRVRTRIGRG